VRAQRCGILDPAPELHQAPVRGIPDKYAMAEMHSIQCAPVFDLFFFFFIFTGLTIPSPFTAMAALPKACGRLLKPRSI
jgi:hypothetical protein